MGGLKGTLATFGLLAIGCICSAQPIYPPVIHKLLVNNQLNPVTVDLPRFSALTLSCQFDAWNPIVTWKLNSESISPSTSIKDLVATFTLPPNGWNMSNTGTYECIVANSKGTAVSSPALVTVGAYIGALPRVGRIPPTHVTFNPGDLITLPCNSSGHISYSPSIWSLFPRFSWYGVPNVSWSLWTWKMSSRYSTNEVGTLYIRNATAEDFQQPYSSLMCVIDERRIFNHELWFAYYNLTKSEVLGSPANSLRLIYKTPDISVAEGTNVVLSCIFDGPNFAGLPIVWNNKFSESADNATRIHLYDVTTDLPSTWTCTYTDATGNSKSGDINVKVLSYPEISGLKDQYATIGSTAMFTCNVRGPTPLLSIKWFKNEAQIIPSMKHITRLSGRFASVLTINMVDKNDIAVISCSATNIVATRRLGVRLIVTERPIATLVALMDTPESESPSDFSVSSNTTVIRFGCIYTLDPDIVKSTWTVAWQMQQFNGDITASTVATDFGLSHPVATYPDQRQSFLTIQYTPESSFKILGTVNCTLIFQILGQTFRVSSDTVGRIYSPLAPTPVIIDTDAQFPFWIIGVSVSALVLILLAVILAFFLQRLGSRKRDRDGQSSAQPTVTGELMDTAASRDLHDDENYEQLNDLRGVSTGRTSPLLESNVEPRGTVYEPLRRNLTDAAAHIYASNEKPDQYNIEPSGTVYEPLRSNLTDAAAHIYASNEKPDQ